MVLRVPSVVICLAVVAAGLVAIAPSSAAATRTPTPVLEKRIIGYSVEHRPIVAYHLGDPRLKRISLLIGQMHGDEHAGVTVADSLIHGSVSVEGLNLWVIPTMNPDGDAAHTRQNAHKVDLNRNWPYRWQHLTGRYYSGPKPLSEPESRAVHRFLLKMRPHYIVSLHQPLDGVDTGTGTARERAFGRTLARNLHLPSTTLHCWSTCYGSMTDWYSHRKLGLAQTVEFGSAPSHAYLVGTVRRGIIKSLNGHFGSLARHNPRLHFTLTSTPGTVHVTGWAYDIDRPAGRVLVRAYERRDLVGPHGHWAQQPSPALDRRRGLSGGHAFAFDITSTFAGKHTYCFEVPNVGAGTKNARRCGTITVDAAS